MPFSGQTNSYVSPRSGLKGLLVRLAVQAYPLTAKHATYTSLSTLPTGNSAAWRKYNPLNDLAKQAACSVQVNGLRSSAARHGPHLV